MTYMSPKTLYVRRNVMLHNALDLLDWAERVGFTGMKSAIGSHVTLIYSKTPVNWDLFTPDKIPLTVRGDCDRIVRQFGDTVVLTLRSIDLWERHLYIRRQGATTDYPIYTPHITITRTIQTLQPVGGIYNVPVYSKQILLDEEIFEEIPDYKLRREA